MSVVFQLRSNENNEFYFHLVDANDEVLLMSAEYPEKSEVEKVIADVRVGTLMGNQIAGGKTKSGETFFVIKDGAGQIIAKSALFSSQMLFDHVLHTVKDNACVATISDLTSVSA